MGATRLIRVGCEFLYTAEIETPAVLQIQPRTPENAVLRQDWQLVPDASLHGYTDLYGNDCQRLVLPVGDSELRYDALVTVPDATEDVDPGARETPPAQLPDDVLIYTLPSRYCLPEAVADEAWQLFGGGAPGYRRGRAGAVRLQSLTRMLCPSRCRRRSPLPES